MFGGLYLCIYEQFYEYDYTSLNGVIRIQIKRLSVFLLSVYIIYNTDLFMDH